MNKLLLGMILLILAAPATPARAAASVGVELDDIGQPTIVVSGAGAHISLGEIQTGLRGNAGLLAQASFGIWLLNANLLIGRGVTLDLSPAGGVSELRLRSQPGRLPASDGDYDYSRFVYLRTDSGIIKIAGVSVRSWDPAAGGVDADPHDGRAYILAKYDARLDISDADLGYLGSADGESYGVAWRDTNDTSSPEVRRQRVTGTVTNSRFHHNYYGVYTFQASNMIFRGNRFDSNVGYGFDPHDYSIDFVVEDNQAFDNGNHGFIISRGCSRFVFRRNVSYRNNNPDPVKLAHGFMLDPGSPNSADPQAPSTDNLFEDNQAFENEGYGLRILGSTGNTIRNNRFERNRQGITVEQGSTGNLLQANLIINNQIHGIFVRGGANANQVLGNTVKSNAAQGIYIKSNGNTVTDNALEDNRGAGISLLPETDVVAAAADLALPGASLSAQPAGLDAELVGQVQAAAAISDNQIIGNFVARSGGYGIELKGAQRTLVSKNTVTSSGAEGIYLADGSSASRIEDNTISNSAGYAIKANGAATSNNSWSRNRLADNSGGTIAVTGGANGGIRPPTLALSGGQITGQSVPGASIELLAASSPGSYVFVRQLSTSGDGSFSVASPTEAGLTLAIATDRNGNSSAAASLALNPSGAPEGNRLYLPMLR